MDNEIYKLAAAWAKAEFGYGLDAGLGLEPAEREKSKQAAADAHEAFMTALWEAKK